MCVFIDTALERPLCVCALVFACVCMKEGVRACVCICVDVLLEPVGPKILCVILIGHWCIITIINSVLAEDGIVPCI